MFDWLKREVFVTLGHAVDEVGFLSAEASKLVVNAAVTTTRNRPHPWSTYADYPCWRGLTDRTYLARHLPAAYVDAASLPSLEAVSALFERPAGGGPLSTKSTCLFPAFAQYLTDGFLRTNPTDNARTTSNHEIDMCPLYGRTVEQTNALRVQNPAPGNLGKLKSQMIGTEEFPPYLYDAAGRVTDPAFDMLDPPLFTHGQALKAPGAPTPPPPAEMDPGAAQSLFAVGGDRANSSPFTSMMNTLWLREHNRIAGELERQNPGFDDERVFQTARNIIIPMFIKIVVEEYINHITPLPFNIKADPSIAWDANWNRPNWMTAEFSLLYRWHGLMPDVIQWPTGDIPLTHFTLDNRQLIAAGLDAAFSAASAQPTAKLGALNTAAALLPIEWDSIQQARDNHLDTYNTYRLAFGMTAANAFSDISSNPAVQTLLQNIYGTVDKVEFYPGLFAEDRKRRLPLLPSEGTR